MLLYHYGAQTPYRRHVELLDRRINPFIRKIWMETPVSAEGPRTSLMHSVHLIIRHFKMGRYALARAVVEPLCEV